MKWSACSTALQAADVALIPVSYSISHSTATRNALKRGTRVLSLPAATRDQLVRGGAEADFEAASPTVRKMADLRELTGFLSRDGGREAGRRTAGAGRRATAGGKTKSAKRR